MTSALLRGTKARAKLQVCDIEAIAAGIWRPVPEARRDHALPLPEGLVGAAAKMDVGKMIDRGWFEEVEANLRRSEPMWRETGDGHGSTLIAAEAGLEAIGI